MDVRGRILILMSAIVAACNGEDGELAVTNDAGSESDGATLRATARSYARDDIPCTSDSDCCVVNDLCTNTALVVGASDQRTVAALIEQANVTERDDCNMCIPTGVEASCGPSGFCVGAPSCGFWNDHCGTRDAGCPTATQSVAPARAHALAIFGCL